MSVQDQSTNTMTATEAINNNTTPSQQQQSLSQLIVQNVNNINQTFFGLVTNYFPEENKYRSLYNQKYFQARDAFTLYTRQAYANLMCAKRQTMNAVMPYYYLVKNEKNQIKQDFRENFIRSDNLQVRKNVVQLGTSLVFIGSIIMLKKGYIRYSIRNGFLFYTAASYVMCPENLNPF